MSGTPQSTGDRHSDDDPNRKGSAPLGKVGGLYAKAKQRVLNKMGKRTTLTKNPRVDYISKKIDKIRAAKAEVAAKGERIKQALTQLLDSTNGLNDVMLTAWKDELGTRQWEESKQEFTRTYNPEENAVIKEMDDAVGNFEADLRGVLEAYFANINETIKRPLTHCSPEEDKRIKQILATKEEYKVVRTHYSDVMIDYESEAAHGEPKQKTLDIVEEARTKYEEESDRLTEAALHFETLYREEVCQRIESHFMGLSQLARGANAAYRDFYPHVKSVALDAREQRAAMKRNVEAARRESGDDALPASVIASLPKVPFGKSVKGATSPGPASADPDGDIVESAHTSFAKVNLDGDTDMTGDISDGVGHSTARPHRFEEDLAGDDSLDGAAEGTTPAPKAGDIFGLDE